MVLTVQLAGDSLSAVQVFRTLAEGRPLGYSAVVLPTPAVRAALATAVLGGPATITFAAAPHGRRSGRRPDRRGERTVGHPAAARGEHLLHQDGGTPAERLSAALGALAALHPDDPRLMLGVVSNPGGTPPLRVVWTDRRAYEKTHTLDAHRLTFDADDTFSTRDGRPVVVRTRRDRRFTPAGWRRWCGRGFPAFDAAAVSWGVTDRLFVTGDGRVGWDTAVTWGVVGERHRPRPVGWAGRGVVEGWDAPWLRVRLPGFVSGRDRGVALQNTASTGADGRTGLHLLPAPNSEGSLSWSGRLDEPLLFEGNVRREAPTVVAPAVVAFGPYAGRVVRLDYLGIHPESALTDQPPVVVEPGGLAAELLLRWHRLPVDELVARIGELVRLRRGQPALDAEPHVPSAAWADVEPAGLPAYLAGLPKRPSPRTARTLSSFSPAPT